MSLLLNDSSLPCQQVFIAGASAYTNDGSTVAVRNSAEWFAKEMRRVYGDSRDSNLFMPGAERLESGMIGVDAGLIFTAEMPFGGVKPSCLAGVDA